LAASFFATPAVSLSCMRPNIAAGFNWAQDSNDTFVIAVGTLQQTSVLLEPSETTQDGISMPTPGAYGADMFAQFLSQDGLGEFYTVPIQVHEECVSQWCGVFPPEDTKLVMILRQDGENLILDSSPCQGAYQSNPSRKAIRVLQACMKTGHCSDKQVMEIQQ
jgi:hypothetical protein